MGDWNWFFSALPQSAAAIVGLGGAFLVTKIVTNEAEFARRHAAAQDLLDEASYLRDKLGARYFGWYNEQSRRRDSNNLFVKLEKFQAKGGLQSAEEYYARGAFSPFIPRDEVIAEIDRLLQLVQIPSPPPRASSRVKEPWMNIPTNPVYTQMEQQQAAALSTDLQDEREQIDQLIVEVDQHIRRITRLRREIESNPEFSTLISRAIALTVALFFVGVVYPLGWLPLDEHPQVSFSPSAIAAALFSFRGGLLTLFTVLFTGSMFLFWRTNSRLRHPRSLLDDLASRSSRAWYSEYLEILDRNQRAEVKSGAPSIGVGVG